MTQSIDLGHRPAPSALRAYLHSETGAISIDWVVLVAALVLMVGALFANISPRIVALITSLFP